MPYSISENLPSPRSLKAELPLSMGMQAFIEEARQVIQAIIAGKDPRFLLILGPCSVHDTTAVYEYATKLKKLCHEVEDIFYPVLRVYFEKPRTIKGWKGFLYDPHLDGSYAVSQGLQLTRQLLLDCASLQLPTSAELLDPASLFYLEDLLSWGCIGARTTASQVHRQLASAASMPIGFKNSIDGNIQCAIEAVTCAQIPHVFLGIDEEGRLAKMTSTGNAHTHIVLRGSDTASNYDRQSITQACFRLLQAQLPARLLIDCSHGNSQKNHLRQQQVFGSVIQQIVEGNSAVLGLMLESHLFAGSQNMAKTASLSYGISITDSCLDWESTRALILRGYQQLQQKHRQDRLTACEPSLALSLSS